MKVLTVVFTFVESYIVSLSAVLLVLSVSRVIQIALFGIIITHISDIAIRSQSVDIKLLGMTFFENGWCFGLALMATSALLANKLIQNRPGYSPATFWKTELGLTLPLGSIKGFTIGFIMASLIALWVSLTLLIDQIHGASAVSSTLLVAVGIFGASTCGANILTARLSEIALTLEANENLKITASRWGLPKEISVISNQYQLIYEGLKTERDRALNLSSKLAHDIKSPIAALSVAKFLLAEVANTEKSTKPKLTKIINILEMTSGVIQTLSNDLLAERKRVVGLELLDLSLERSIQLAQLAYPLRKIMFERDSELPALYVNGLGRTVQI